MREDQQRNSSIFMHKDWSPLENETAEQYVERLDTDAELEDVLMNNLKTHFGLSDGDAKEVSLTSRPFWERFFRAHVEGIHKRGGTRYAAERYIQRKNSNLRNGAGIFSAAEINELIDSVGDWPN